MSTPSTAKDGGPAFPFPADHTCNGNNGMSLRDWFAGQALAGIAGMDAETAIATGKLAERCGLSSDQIMATQAYQHADAMLAAREAQS